MFIGAVLLLVVFATLNVVLARARVRVEHHLKRRSVWMQRALIASIAATGACALVAKYSSTFSSERWKSADASSSSTRYYMVGDLERRHPLVGSSRERMLELLGAPSQYNLSHEGKVWDLKYQLGPSILDYHWLLIRFSGDAVVEYKLYED